MEEGWNRFLAFVAKNAVYFIGVPLAIGASLTNLAIKKRFTFAIVAAKVFSGLFAGMLVFVLLHTTELPENYKAFMALVALYIGDGAIIFLVSKFWPSVFEIIHRSTKPNE